jgi:hypothetical protein
MDLPPLLLVCFWQSASTTKSTVDTFLDKAISILT